MSKPFTITVPGVTSTPPMCYTLLEITADNIDAQKAFIEGCYWASPSGGRVRLDAPYVVAVGDHWRKDANGYMDIVSAAWVTAVPKVVEAAATSAEIHAWVVKNLADLTPSLATPDNLLEAAVRLHVYADRLGFDLTAALTDHVRGGAERSEAPKHTPTPEEQYAALTPEERAALPPEALPGGWY